MLLHRSAIVKYDYDGVFAADYARSPVKILMIAAPFLPKALHGRTS